MVTFAVQRCKYMSCLPLEQTFLHSFREGAELCVTSFQSAFHTPSARDSLTRVYRQGHQIAPTICASDMNPSYLCTESIQRSSECLCTSAFVLFLTGSRERDRFHPPSLLLVVLITCSSVEEVETTVLRDLSTMSQELVLEGDVVQNKLFPSFSCSH